MTSVGVGAFVADMRTRDRCGVFAGPDGEFFAVVQDPVVGVLDDDGDQFSGVTLAELDALPVDHDLAVGVDAPLGLDRTPEPVTIFV